MHIATFEEILLFMFARTLSLLLIKLNKTCEASFKDCIGQLLLQHDIACIIYDEFMYFCGGQLRSLSFLVSSLALKVLQIMFHAVFLAN